MISFSTGKLRKKTVFQQIRSLFSFSIAQTEKNSWNKLVKLSDDIVKRVATPIYGSHPCRSSRRVHRCRFGQTHRTGTVPNMTLNVTLKIYKEYLLNTYLPNMDFNHFGHNSSFDRNTVVICTYVFYIMSHLVSYWAMC